MAFKVLYDLNALTQPSADELGLYSFILVRQGTLVRFGVFVCKSKVVNYKHGVGTFELNSVFTFEVFLLL